MISGSSSTINPTLVSVFIAFSHEATLAQQNPVMTLDTVSGR
jgi:hypothetical protein